VQVANILAGDVYAKRPAKDLDILASVTSQATLC
jgi:hypothetical protein